MTTLSPEAQKIVKEIPEQIKEIASYVLCNQTNSISETIRNLFNVKLSELSPIDDKYELESLRDKFDSLKKDFDQLAEKIKK